MYCLICDRPVEAGQYCEACAQLLAGQLGDSEHLTIALVDDGWRLVARPAAAAALYLERFGPRLVHS